MNKKTLGTILTVVIVAFAVLTGLSAYVETIDASTVPEAVAPLFAFLSSFFGAGTVMVAVAFIRNISGYLMENARNEYGEIYEDKKLYGTLIYYIGIVGTVAAIIPAPYNQIGVVALVIIDIVKQVLKDLWKQ